LTRIHIASSEHECLIARLQAKYVERIFEALFELKVSLITARNALRDAESAPEGPARDWARQNAAKNNEKAGQELLEVSRSARRMVKCSW
jgi:hypothetical protein